MRSVKGGRSRLKEAGKIESGIRDWLVRTFLTRVTPVVKLSYIGNIVIFLVIVITARRWLLNPLTFYSRSL
jgi:hypothetical protein